MSFTKFRFPTNITFGQNSASTIPTMLVTKKIKRPFVVCDKNLIEKDFFICLLQDLERADIFPQVFSSFSGNPKENEVYDGSSLYQEAKCDAFLLVGGGSSIDIGKAIALITSHKGKIVDYEDGVSKSFPIENKIPFMLAIPTTSGTGSEVGGSTVISENISKRKVIIWSPYLIPGEVVADSTWTFSLPQQITAATGIDALTHCLEAYLSNTYHPMADGIALEGIALIRDNLLTCYNEPSHGKARDAMLMASMMGAVAFQKGLGVVHSCAHALSGCYDMHHGLANALMLDAAMEFNRSSCQQKFYRLSKTIAKKDKSLDFMEWLLQLKNNLGIDGKKNYDIKVDDKLVDMAFADPCHQSNPIPCTREDIQSIFQTTFSYE